MSCQVSMNMIRALRLSLLFAFIFALFAQWLVVPSMALAENEWISSDGALELTIPADYQEKAPRSDLQGATNELLLGSRGAEFPTFNVLRIDSPFAEAKNSQATMEQQVLDSYRLVGLLDAKIISSRIIDLDELSLFSALISYSAQGLQLISSLLIVPLKDHHYIMTFTQTNSTAHNELAAATDIAALFSVRLTEKGRILAKNAENSPKSQKNNLTFGMLLFCISAFLILACTTLFLFKKHQSFRIK